MILLSFISEKLQQLCQTSNLSDTRQEKDDRVNQISQVAAQKSPFGSLRRVLKTGCTDQLIQVVEGDFIPKKAVGSFSSFVHLPQDQADLQVVCSGRRRTCALLNSPSPCVNKAIHHMQELKMTVENWCQQSGKYQPPADQNKHQYSKTSRFQPRHSDTESVTSTELFVEGVAISTRGEQLFFSNTTRSSLNDLLLLCHREANTDAFDAHAGNCALSPLLKKINDVLREVVCLIERLEADRQFADEALHKEKRRKRFLENKVDSISLWKQQEHSFVVKKEHEACNRDISGLKWQLKLEKEKLDQAQGKLSNAEVLNLHLQEDINFAKKQIPIVKENLGLQRTIIDRINTAQAEADEVHAKTQSDLLMVQKELKKMQLDANNEKIALDHELLAKKNQLANRVEELNQLTMLEKSICAEINVAEKTIAVTEEKCAAIRQRIPEMIELEKTEKDQILHLKLQIEDKMQKNKKLRGKVIALQEDVERSKLNGEAEVSCLEEQLHSKSNAFAALRKENMEYEQNVEDYKTRISERIKDDDILLRICLLHQAQCADTEEGLKRQKRSSELTNRKLHKDFEDAYSATQALQMKVEKTKKVMANLEQIHCDHRNALHNLEREKKVRGDRLRAAQDLHAATIKRYDNALGRISDLRKKSKEYQDASDKMEEIVESMPEVIEELQSVFDAVAFKNKSAALIMSTLQSDINNCQRQTQRSMQTHTAHVTARRKKMEETKLSLLQKRMHKALVKYFKQRSLYSQAELDRCQALSQETNRKIKTAQGELSEEIQLIAAFLQSLADDSTTTDEAGVNQQSGPDAAGSNE
ncbi:hypothetical protein F2P81_000507 [Scophthalmus maximus]|uniref:Coiled-coil domain-containing protein 178 n=1 Tax=Scophthalmus maximus TaxID=52904 RepID=A0A6A4TUJ1_SCOMX|nr:hypothetical protein F2P81_000507 [Scophthalmus maximus]